MLVTAGGEKSQVRGAVADDAWLQGEFITTVQNRGGAIIAARKLSSAASAAQAIVDHMRDWVKGTPEVLPPSPRQIKIVSFFFFLWSW